MKNLLICAVLMAIIVTGESLSCNSCSVGFSGKCLIASTEKCANTSSCYKGELVLNVTQMMRFHSRGCVSQALCNNTETGSLLTFNYTVKRDCCETDNCNRATSVQLPVPAALAAALTAVWSQLNL